LALAVAMVLLLTVLSLERPAVSRPSMAFCAVSLVTLAVVVEQVLTVLLLAVGSLVTRPAVMLITPVVPVVRLT